MTNEMVDALCRSASQALAHESNQAVLYAGVFCANAIPRALARRVNQESCCVVNLAKSPRSRTSPSKSGEPLPSYTWPLSSKEKRLLADIHKRDGVGWRDVASAAAKASLPPDSGHFVFLHFSKDCVFYADSFGLPCYQADVRAYLSDACERRKVDLKFTKVTLQHPSSMACGLYACLRVLATQAGEDVAAYRWNKRDLKRNDVLCIEYIQALLSRE